MTRSWKLTDLEFVVAWETSQADVLPAPFVVTSRTPLYHDYQREKRAIREEQRATFDPAFDRVLEVVARPDIRIEVHGWGADREDAGSQIRLLGVRRGADGYLLKQLPGETAWHSGGYVITECAPLELAATITSELPEADPGSRGETVLARRTRERGIDYSYGRSLVHDSFDDTVEQRAEELLRAPTTGAGIVTVAQGFSRFGPRGVTAVRLPWRDLCDDGRYVITPGPPAIAAPADTKRLIGLVNEAVAEVVSAIRDERY